MYKFYKNNTFKAFLVSKGIKQKEFAKYLKVSEGYISNLICGRAPMSEETIKFFTTILKCNPEDIGFVLDIENNRYIQKEYLLAVEYGQN